ncbi:hydrolase, NUDIX family [[Eubacterium] yurii subsp. margaretiae ATCC 43715]|nr:hydrolase, NUDIX family [[Eubacterium] yurii subsp. margaretiae ATCC 43715]
MNDVLKIRNIFENRKPTSIKKIKEVSVIIAFMNINDKLHLIFEKRSGSVNQSGDLSFIGGHIEEDETPLSAAIRETKEECNLSEDNINIIGESDYLINFNSLFVHTFVCEITNIKFEDIDCNDEVEKLIAVPLEEIISTHPSSYKSKITVERDENFPYHLIENGRNYNFFSGNEVTYFYEFKNCIVWGLTAKILNNFVEILKDGDFLLDL